jgi:hypothetical protein
MSFRRKKQNGGIIDDPANCNNDTTPIDFEDIKENTDVIYIGNLLEGNKYNCIKPTELREIILHALTNRNPELRIPLNPLNRQPLDNALVQRIIRMYPVHFENIINLEDDEDDEDDDEDNEPELEIVVGLTVEEMTPILLRQYPVRTAEEMRNARRDTALKRLLRERYRSDDMWNQWYNNQNIPIDHKNAMINYFKFVDSFNNTVASINNNLLSIELMDLLNYPIRGDDAIDFKFHYVYRDYPNIRYIVGIIITHELAEDESNERLEDLNITDTDNWSVYNICGIAVEEPFSNNHESMNELLKLIFSNDDNNKLITVGYDTDFTEPEDPESRFLYNILDFYAVGNLNNREGMSSDYAELYATYDVNNNKLYIGKNENIGGRRKKKSKKIVYKRKSSKKKSSKRKTSSKKKKSSKRRSLKRK